MRFRFVRCDDLPCLAWHALLRSGCDEVVVTHGADVETTGEFFVEGAWNGPFAGGGFPESTAFVGSGAVLVKEGVEFSTPSHPLDRLQSMRDGERLHVSNSLVGLLAATGDRLCPSYRQYDRDFQTLLLGLSSAIRFIPTAAGRRIQLYFCERLLVRSDLSQVSLPRTYETDFDDYEDYVSHMDDLVLAVAANASDTSRSVTYAPLATISTGYDSAAAAVFAQNAGCTEALTMREARSSFGVNDDSGHEVAQSLGLRVHEYGRDDYLTRKDIAEAEFLAVGTGGEDVVLSGFEPMLRGSLLFTGYRGGTVWNRTREDPASSLDFVQGDMSGTSLTEFRLRIGFLHLPLPALTYTATPSLRRVANSAAMDPWSMHDNQSRGIKNRWRDARGWSGKAYDRPIPRRILEERGVPRDAFGIRKAAVSQPFYHNERLEEILAPATLTEFREWTRLHTGRRFDATVAIFLVASIAYRVNYLVSRALKITGTLLGFVWTLPMMVSGRYAVPLSENSYLVHWGVDQVLARYAGLTGSNRGTDLACE